MRVAFDVRNEGEAGVEKDTEIAPYVRWCDGAVVDHKGRRRLELVPPDQAGMVRGADAGSGRWEVGVFGLDVLDDEAESGELSGTEVVRVPETVVDIERGGSSADDEPVVDVEGERCPGRRVGRDGADDMQGWGDVNISEDRGECRALSSTHAWGGVRMFGGAGAPDKARGAVGEVGSEEPLVGGVKAIPGEDLDEEVVLHGGKELRDIEGQAAGDEAVLPTCMDVVGQCDGSVDSGALLAAAHLVGMKELEGVAIEVEPFREHALAELADAAQEHDRAVGLDGGIVWFVGFGDDDGDGSLEGGRPVAEAQAGVENLEEDIGRVVRRGAIVVFIAGHAGESAQVHPANVVATGGGVGRGLELV